MEHKFIKEFTVGEKIVDFYLVKSKRNKSTRNGKPFLDLDLADNSGQVNAKVWDRAEKLSQHFKRGDIIKIMATVDEYQGTKQLKITELRALDEGDEIDWADLTKQSPHDPVEMRAYLQARIEEIKDEDLRRLMESFFSDKAFMDAFMDAPAARNIHHAYAGGLLEHTTKVTKTAVFAADVLYPGEVDRDLLVAGAILHDVGKILELQPADGGYTTEGYLLGHITLAADMIRDQARKLEGFPHDLLMELVHVVIAHHGEKEWGSPAVPQTPEAMIVHIADNLDAKTQIALTAIADDLNEEEQFTQYHRTLQRHFYKGPKKKKGEGDKS